MKRRRTRARRYGLRTRDEFRSPPADVSHAYWWLLSSMYNNAGVNKGMWRHWGARDGIPKPVTDRVLTIAERRGHVWVHEGRYYLTARGTDVVRRRRTP